MNLQSTSQDTSTLSRSASNSERLPRVSVVMPVYNAAAYLPETIESILNQSFDDFEFIIVDDASSDGSWEILQAYSMRDRRIVLQRNEQNAGACITSNLVLSLAQGEFIARQDHDDIALPERLAAQVAYFDNHPAVGLLGTAYYRLNMGDERRLRFGPKTHTEIRWQLLFDCALCHSTAMMRRQLFETGELYYREPACVQDYDLWVRLARSTKVYILPTPYVIYRELEQSMTTQYGTKMQQATNEVAKEQISKLLPDHKFTLVDIQTLRQLRSPRQVNKTHLRLANLIFDLLAALAQESDVDPKIITAIRQAWIKKVVLASHYSMWRQYWTARLLSRMWQYGLGKVLIDMPMIQTRRTIQRISKISWQSTLPLE